MKPQFRPLNVERPFREPGTYIADDHTAIVAKLYDGQEHYAPLFATAPELLESLRQTVASLEHWFPRWGDPEGAKSAMMQKARAAIAKAEGDRTTPQTWADYAKQVEAIATEFDIRLKTELGDVDYGHVLMSNADDENVHACHSHDYCDANMVMAAAIKHVTGRDAVANDPYDGQLWNDAWQSWKKRHGAHSAKGGAK